MGDLRPVVGLDVAPAVGMRVVGADESPYQDMGLGTVVATLERSNEAGMCAVRWDKEHLSARPAAEYCCGRNSIFSLEVAQEDDLLLGRKDVENIYTLAAASLRLNLDSTENSFVSMSSLSSHQSSSGVLPFVQSARGVKESSRNPRALHANAPPRTAPPSAPAQDPRSRTENIRITRASSDGLSGQNQKPVTGAATADETSNHLVAKLAMLRSPTAASPRKTSKVAR